jgi:hypothetical protein
MNRILLSLSAAAVLCAAGCSDSTFGPLPEVADAEALVRDAKALQATHPAATIAPQDWPASIAALHPQTVETAPTRILITVEAKTGIGADGYLVALQSIPDEGHWKLHATSQPALYSFQWQP